MLAHNVSGGSQPAPPWLLGYIGAFALLLTVVALRSGWPKARLALTNQRGEADDARRLDVSVGRCIGLVLLIAVLIVAVVGSDSGAANGAPRAVLVIWWVGLPMLCLLVGDVMRAINPFVPVVALLERVRPPRADAPAAPPWTAAAILGAFSWYLLAYHSPGSPRALAVFLGLYVAATLAGALRWGRGWLADGEGFAGVARAVSLLSPRRRGGPVRGLLPLVVVWLGGTVFTAVTYTTFWLDVLGHRRGWDRALVNTVGLVWMIASVAAVALAVLRLTEGAGGDERASAVDRLGLALLPVALTWFVAQDLAFLLLEGQSFYILMSDPLGRGWDLFGTIDNGISYRLIQGEWLRWVQIGTLLAGHVGAVTLAHDAAVRTLGLRRGVRTTWAVAAAGAASIVLAAMVVVG